MSSYDACAQGKGALYARRAQTSHLRRRRRDRSIKRAAETLSYTPPAVSQQIAALERHLGCALFDRGPRGVRLTEAGQVLLTLARDVLDRLDVAESTLTNLARSQLGPLRVAAFASAGWRLIPQAFAMLQARHPALRFSLLEAEPHEALAHVKAGHADVAVTYTFDGVPPPREPVLQTWPLARDPLHVVLPNGHALAQRRSVALSELADETWIAGAPDATCTRATLHACHAAGFAPDIQFHTNDFTTAYGMAAAGLGVALLPTLALPAPAHGISHLPITHDPVARHIHAVLRPHADDQPSSLHTDTLRCLSAAAQAQSPREIDAT
jgi:DNA-binding transcriptional LysR family regulator